MHWKLFLHHLPSECHLKGKLLAHSIRIGRCIGRVAMVKRPSRYDKASEEVNKKVKKVQSDGATPATSSLSNWVGLSANDVRQ